jgi:hypothetical protein
MWKNSLQPIYETIIHYSSVLFWCVVGVTAKLATLNKNKRITKFQALATIATGLLCGFIAHSLSNHFHVTKDLYPVFISLAALMGENITGWLMVNSSDLLGKIVEIFFKKK